LLLSVTDSTGGHAFILLLACGVFAVQFPTPGPKSLMFAGGFFIYGVIAQWFQRRRAADLDEFIEGG
jgi:hypothetical protein